VTFAEWYAANVAPNVEAQVKSLPAQHREPLRAASRAAMAECWNAAIKSAADVAKRCPRCNHQHAEDGINCGANIGIPGRVCECDADYHAHHFEFQALLVKNS
jgi:hypothetical protein